MNALQKWAIEGADGRGSGRISGLAKHLGISQPAVTKIIQKGSHENMTYAKSIMEYTQLPAEELFPFWVDIFKYSEELKVIEKEKKKNDIQSRIGELKSELELLNEN